MGVGIFLMRISKHTQSFKLYFLNRINQILDIRFGFSRMTNQQSGPQSYPRNSVANRIQHLISPALGNSTSHRLKHIIRYMLNRNIQIVTNITAFGHYLQHIQWKLRWISIMQTQPLQPFHIGKMLHQVGQLAIAINIQTITGRILGNQHHFFHAILHQPLNFLFDDLYGPRNVLTTHQRDGTERTRSITTL